jgi:tetratricopeptide (TPR) repeat protein
MTTLTHIDGVSERTLRRLLKFGAFALVLLLVAFGVVYFLGQRVDSGPTLAERQVSAAEDAVKASPQNVQNRLKLAATYQAVGRFDDAVAQFDEVLKAVPSNNTALLGLGSVKQQQGDLGAAKAAFTKITSAAKTAEFSSVDPTREAAYYWLGSIALQQNDPDTAMTQLNAALGIDNSDADAWYLLGSAQAKKGADKVAIQSLTRALLFVPTGWCDPYAALGTAYSHLKMADQATYAGAMNDFCNKKPALATQELEGITNGPAAVDAMLGLGLIAESGSDRSGAVSWYQKALKAEPGNPTALTALSRLGAKPAAANASKTTATSTTTGKAS